MPPGGYYPTSFKDQVVREYQSGYSMNYLRGKYGIGGADTIPRWLKEKGLRPIPRKNYLAAVNPSSSNKTTSGDNTSLDPQALQQQLKAAQEQLADANLKAEMLERMIELAEQHHQINIRKKPNTK